MLSQQGALFEFMTVVLVACFCACSPFQVPAIRSKADLRTDICRGVIGKPARLAHPAAIEHRGEYFAVFFDFCRVCCGCLG
jgi:hypothetical protein